MVVGNIAAGAYKIQDSVLNIKINYKTRKVIRVIGCAKNTTECILIYTIKTTGTLLIALNPEHFRWLLILEYLGGSMQFKNQYYF